MTLYHFIDLSYTNNVNCQMLRADCFVFLMYFSGYVQLCQKVVFSIFVIFQEIFLKFISISLTVKQYNLLD